MASLVFMIQGKIGAGKTTVAKLMAEKLPAYRISHDEMLVRAYGPQIPAAEFRLCCERINDLAWDTVAKLSKLSVLLPKAERPGFSLGGDSWGLPN